MDFRKERNFIVAYDGSLKVGAWDISTGDFIGKSGKPVKSCPKCFTYNNLNSYFRVDGSQADLLSYAIRRYREWMGDTWRGLTYNDNRPQRFEAMISLGIMPSEWSDLNDDTPLTKDVVKYVKENCRGEYRRNQVRDYIIRKQYANLLDGKPDWWKDAFNMLICELPLDYIKSALNRCANEHVDAFVSEYNVAGRVAQYIKDYYTISINLFQKVEVEHNFLTKLSTLYFLNEEYKNKHYNEVLRRNNDKPWLYYEDETFIIKPLLSKEEFHYEGTHQHNCVERMYMSRVYNGDTNVVAIRRKSSPDETYITCEVNHGRIWQYYAAFNQNPQERDAIALKSVYQEYINSNYPG